MGLDAGPDAGGLEPIPLKFYSVYYPASDYGERKATPSETLYCTRYFRYSRIYGREITDLAQTKAGRTTTVEIRRDRLSSAITTNMTASHGSMSFGIDDIQPKPNNSALLLVTLKSLQPVSSVAEPAP